MNLIIELIIGIFFLLIALAIVIFVVQPHIKTRKDYDDAKKKSSLFQMKILLVFSGGAILAGIVVIIFIITL